jgi:hypothetical protein
VDRSLQRVERRVVDVALGACPTDRVGELIEDLGPLLGQPPL